MQFNALSAETQGQHMMEILRETQEEWIHAPDDQRDTARERFMDALYVLTALLEK